MSNIENEKSQIYDLLFYDWTPTSKSKVKPEVMAIIKASFDYRDKQSMSLARTALQYTTRQPKSFRLYRTILRSGCPIVE